MASSPNLHFPSYTWLESKPWYVWVETRQVLKYCPLCYDKTNRLSRLSEVKVSIENQKHYQKVCYSSRRLGFSLICR
jgi:hypothetical protein